MTIRATARVCAAIASVSLATLTACRDDAHEIELAARVAHQQPAIAPATAGAGTADTHGLPIGYPADVPLVPGAESMSGGVEPGVVSTAIVRYRLPRARYLEALETLLENAQFRVTDEGIGPTGAHRLRARKGSRAVSFLVADEGPNTRVDVISLEPRRPSAGTTDEPSR